MDDHYGVELVCKPSYSGEDQLTLVGKDKHELSSWIIKKNRKSGIGDIKEHAIACFFGLLFKRHRCI
jgi:hypothetical protein